MSILLSAAARTSLKVEAPVVRGSGLRVVVKRGDSVIIRVPRGMDEVATMPSPVLGIGSIL